MATNAAPVYGKQYIRYAETWEAAVNDQSGAAGVVEIGELCAVSPANWAGAFGAAVGAFFTSQPTVICGVNQAYVPTALAQPYTARQMTVATSGLLLIEVAPLSASFGLNSNLAINGLGQADAGGTTVTMNGVTPVVREEVTIGGRRLVLVSFA
jgi:hypothetical protein